MGEAQNAKGTTCDHQHFLERVFLLFLELYHSMRYTFIPRTLLLLISLSRGSLSSPGSFVSTRFPPVLQDGISCPIEQGDSHMQPLLHNHDLGTKTKLWAKLARLQGDNASVSANAL
jgi:hypothetical protein